jgi:hypothetical protein
MNRLEKDFGPAGLAQIEFRHGEYRVIVPGSYVLCAVTGQRIPLQDLRYWNVERQEAYASPLAAAKRYEELTRQAHS